MRILHHSKTTDITWWRVEHEGEELWVGESDSVCAWEAGEALDALDLDDLRVAKAVWRVQQATPPSLPVEGGPLGSVLCSHCGWVGIRDDMWNEDGARCPSCHEPHTDVCQTCGGGGRVQVSAIGWADCPDDCQPCPKGCGYPLTVHRAGECPSISENPA